MADLTFSITTEKALVQIHSIQISCGLRGEGRWKEMRTVCVAELKGENKVL